MAQGGSTQSAGESQFPTQTVTGLLLCRAANNRFAFLAAHVASIEAFRPGVVPHASRVFEVEGTGGKIIRHASGLGIGVDTLEVHGEEAPLLPAPRLILAGVGGSLYGFVALNGGLYPVLRLSEFVRYISQKTPRMPA